MLDCLRIGFFSLFLQELTSKIEVQEEEMKTSEEKGKIKEEKSKKRESKENWGEY